MKKITTLFFLLPVLITAIPGKTAEDARAAYERMRTQINGHQTYTITYDQYTARGSDRELMSTRTVKGKYIQRPAHYCESITKAESSFDDQCTEGCQECYTECAKKFRPVMSAPRGCNRLRGY